MSVIPLPDGRKLGYAEYGDRRGHPVLYFPGFPCSRLDAKQFQETAVKMRCRLIGIDRPGLGLSTQQPHRSILSWPADVISLADFLRIDRFSILSHSAGSAYAAACALAIPQRISKAMIVSGMAPLDRPGTRAGLPKPTRIASHLVSKVPILAYPFMWITYRGVEKLQLGELPEVDQTTFQDPHYHSQFKEVVLEAFRNGISGPAREMQLICKPWGVSLEEIKIPVEIWHGGLDSIVSVSHGRILAAAIPNGQLKIFENEGHLSLLKNHQEAIIATVCV